VRIRSEKAAFFSIFSCFAIRNAMPSVLMSLWQKIVKPQNFRRSHQLTGSTAERTVWIQECMRVAALDDVPATENPERFPAKVEEVSKSEICLRASKQVRRSSLLSIELPHGEGGSADCVLAYVIRSSPAGESWVLSCVFSTELSDEDLRSFGGCKTRPAPPTRRGWSRFPFQGPVTYRSLHNPDQKRQTAQAVDISPTGIGLVVNEAIEAGAVLNLEIAGRLGRSERVLEACVVRSGAMAEGRWRLGCNFIRQLQENELQGFLS
jgi:hypothetical protein